MATTALKFNVILNGTIVSYSAINKQENICLKYEALINMITIVHKEYTYYIKFKKWTPRCSLIVCVWGGGGGGGGGTFFSHVNNACMTASFH